MIFWLTANEVNPSATQNLLKTLKKFRQPGLRAALIKTETQALNLC